VSAPRFVEEARKLIGARWRHRGRTSWAVDCIGLVAVAGSRCGLLAADVRGYGREPWDDQLRAGCRQRWGEPVADIQAGDVALIRWAHGEPSHLAIVGDHPDGGLTLIHAHNLQGVVEVSMAGKLAECVVEVYRPRFA
jgi:cell wall-associated NlpC family hydrolase